MAMDIRLVAEPEDIDFHPSNQLFAVGLVNGDLVLFRYAADTPPQKLLTVKAHSTEACSALRFINEGRAIVTGSPDCSILATDVETGTAIARLDKSHRAAIHRIVNLTESTIASGDDKGCIKVWDIRQCCCINSFQAHGGYISDLAFASDSMKLLGTCGEDGTLSVCNLRSNKVQTKSEFAEDALLSIVIMKNGRKVICGTQSGPLLLYSWGFLKDYSDRFVDLSPNSVDCLLKVDEDRVITGCENGLISLVGILPNRIIQPIAEHPGFPVERLAFSHDRRFLLSMAYREILKLWDLGELLQDSGNAKREGDGMDVDDTTSKSHEGSTGTKRKSTMTGRDLSSSNNFFANL